METPPVPPDPAARRLAAALEQLINRQGSRGAQGFLRLTRGTLLAAAGSLVAGQQPSIAFATGFYLPHATPPAAESDGPVGVAIAARILGEAGLPVAAVTDRWSAPVVGAALVAAGAGDTPLLVGAAAADRRRLVDGLAGLRTTHLVFVERPGAAPDGRRRSMTGRDVSVRNLDLGPLAAAGPWLSVGIGDGGNEVGMGGLPAGLVAAAIRGGNSIRATTRVDYLLTATVSNWGCYALLAMLGLLDARLADPVDRFLTGAFERRVFDGAAAGATMVDGVKLACSASIDGFPLVRSGTLIAQMRTLLSTARTSRRQRDG